MLQGKTHVRAGQPDQACAEVFPTVLGGAGRDGSQPLEAMQGQGVEEGLFIREVAARRGVADAQFAAEFTQGEAARAATLQRARRCL